MAANIEILCPCCESLIVIDRVTGEILLHKKKESKSGLSLEAMVANLDSQKSELAKKFDKNMESQKDRARKRDQGEQNDEECEANPERI